MTALTEAAGTSRSPETGWRWRQGPRRAVKSTTAVRSISRIRHAVLMVLALAATTTGLMFVSAPAQASATYCGNGQCTVYLSKSETRALASGQVPGASSVPAGPLRTSYYALVYGHRWFAGQYANRGWCSAFTLNVRPWATQGYWGYACNWN